jgi:hypothetical protein
MNERQVIRILSNLKGAATANPEWSQEQLLESTMMDCNCTKKDCIWAINHSPPMSDYEAYDFMFASDGLLDLMDVAIPSGKKNK